MKQFIGKEVKIYPNDTYEKFGIVEEITNSGVVFTITTAHVKSNYKPGDVVFIAYSANLIFSLRK